MATGIILGLGVVLGMQNFIRPYKYEGAVINPPYPAGDFKLTNQAGQPLKLSDLRGKVILLFFGYSQCADICPATLAEFKQIHTQLGDRAKDAAFVFITVDPEHDTPGVLIKYLAKFDPAITGLTGTAGPALTGLEVLRGLPAGHAFCRKPGCHDRSFILHLRYRSLRQSD